MTLKTVAEKWHLPKTGLKTDAKTEMKGQKEKNN
jgi:hypothetical protein